MGKGSLVISNVFRSILGIFGEKWYFRSISVIWLELS